MPFMTRIAADLIAAGLDVDAVPGWETRGSSVFAPGGVTCHWTGGPRGTVGRPSLRVVVDGYAGLPGPLSHVYLARTGTAVIVAAGRANHAGRGGWRGLVGNSSVYGIEAESGGDNDWTPAMRDAYPVLAAALVRGLGRGAEWVHGHNEWADPPGRKIDIRDWPMPLMRAQVAGILSASTVSNPLTVGGHIILPGVGPAPAPLKKKGDDMIVFIQALYAKYLGRPGSPTEWAGHADAAIRQGLTYTETEAAFRRNPAEGGTVVQAYQAYLNRAPKAEEIAAWSDTETIDDVWRGVAQSPEAQAVAARA